MVDADNPVDALTPTDYTIHYTQDETTPGQTIATAAELFLGQDAVDAENDFRAKQAAFQQASIAYDQAEQAWLQAVDEANARRQAGEDVTVPPEPERPQPIGLFSNGLTSP